MDDLEVLRMLKKASAMSSILINGHELRNKQLRDAVDIATERGWLDLGQLHQGDQWSWYNATITAAGHSAIRDVKP